MKRFAMAMCLCIETVSFVCGQEQRAVTDTLWNIDLQEVEVMSTRATRTTPVAFTNISQEELQRKN